MSSWLSRLFPPTDLEREVAVKLAELSVALTAVRDDLAKAKAEIVGKIGALEAALADVEVPAEASAALADVVAAAKALDDVVPDA
jgi:hypothetical protein